MPFRQAIWWAIIFSGLAAAQVTTDEASRLNDEAIRLSNAGKYEDAERSYRAALALASQDNLATASLCTNLAKLYQGLDRFTDAEALYRRALELRRKSLPPASPEIAHSMNDLAQIYWNEGRSWEARNLLEAAVGKLEKSAPQDPQLPLLLNNLAVIHSDFGEYREAEKLLRAALSSCEDLHGPQSLEFAVALNNLAQVLEANRDYDNAGLMYSKAIGILENLGPRAVPDLAGTLANLGHFYYQRNLNQKAEQAERQALDVVDSTPPVSAPLRATILHNLGNILAVNNSPEVSLPYFAQSLEIRQKTLAPEHPAIILLLLDYAKATLHAGQKSLSKQLHKQAQQLAERRSRKDLSQLSVSLESLK